MNKNLLLYLRLYLTKNITCNVFHKLMRYFNDDIAKIIENFEAFMKEKKYDIKLCSNLEVSEYLERCNKEKIKLICVEDVFYPKNIKVYNEMPFILHCKGNIELLGKKNKVAIVGSRNSSLQSLALTKQIVKELSSEFITVSGLAKGIDAVVHENSSNNTIAVLGNGIDRIYPAENEKLYEKIINNGGLIISEFRLNYEPRPYHFSYRNRLISALADVVVVAEASIKSGSLITAKYALEQGKEIFAVPGHPYDVRMSGTNYLIKNGSFLLQSAQDIINHFKNNYQKNNEILFEELSVVDAIDQTEYSITNIEDEILSKLGSASINVHQILELMPYDAKLLQKAIGQLELFGKIENNYGMIRKI